MFGDGLCGRDVSTAAARIVRIADMADRVNQELSLTESKRRESLLVSMARIFLLGRKPPDPTFNFS
jgi:hypothetical protein